MLLGLISLYFWPSQSADISLIEHFFCGCCREVVLKTGSDLVLEGCTKIGHLIRMYYFTTCVLFLLQVYSVVNVFNVY